MIIACLIVLPIGGYLYIQNKWIVEPLPLRSKIPSVTISTIDGRIIKSDSIFVNKTVVIFFSTTCEHCKTEMLNLNSCYEKFKNYFEIVAFSLNDKQETKKFIEKLKVSFPVFVDSTGEAKHQFRVLPIPALFFINQKKQLVKYQAGEQSKELLESTLAAFALLSNDSLLTAL